MKLNIQSVKTTNANIYMYVLFSSNHVCFISPFEFLSSPASSICSNIQSVKTTNANIYMYVLFSSNHVCFISPFEFLSSPASSICSETLYEIALHAHSSSENGQLASFAFFCLRRSLCGASLAYLTI